MECILENFSKELKKIFTIDFRYMALLVYFLLMFYSLVYYDLPLYIQLFFMIGLLLIPSSYQQKVKEIAELKMKVLYVKTKLSDRINDFEKVIKEKEQITVDESMEKVLTELKFENTHSKVS